MAKVIISIPTAKGLMFLLGVNFEKSEITMKAPSSEHIFTEEFVLQENQTKVVTNSHFFPIDFLYRLFIENNCISEEGQLLNVE